MTNFDQAFTWLMGDEGRYSNNPADPGGETMWGITVGSVNCHFDIDINSPLCVPINARP